MSSFSLTPAIAHLAIRLDIRAPESRQRLGSDTDVIVFAQPTLAGVDHVSFTATLDGEALDPATGRSSSQPVPLDIRVSTSKRIPLRNLTPGAHRFTISYRPDTDEPTRETTVEFTVRRASDCALACGAAIAGGPAVAVAVPVLLIRRQRRSTTRLFC